MTPQRYAELEQIYFSALELPPPERRSYIRHACGGDSDLISRLERMLEATEDKIGFLESPALAIAVADAVREPALAPGLKVGRYELVSILGCGGMGQVYLATDTVLRRKVALKIVPELLRHDRERVRRFVQEARAASKLNHPNIATIYDAGEDSGIPFIAMEHLEGRTLDQVIPNGGLSVGTVIGYATQIASALAAAHASGVIHRDVKPSNIMIIGDERVKLLDFGLAKDVLPVAGGSAAHTTQGAVIGTVAYMSPEQAEGKALDPTTDIFSFGAVIYEALTGRRAFQGDSRISTLAAVLRDDPRPVRELSPRVPPQLENLVIRCLRKEPSRRFQSVAELLTALAEVERHGASHVRSRRAARLWSLSALAALATGAVWWIDPRPPIDATPLEPVPLTSYPGVEFAPTFSPSGDRVAFSWDGGKSNFDIYVKVIGVEPPLRVTQDADADTSPAWSPNGRHIAFLRSRETGDVSLILIPALGGPERIVGRFQMLQTSRHTGVSWSPDGKWIAIARLKGGPGDRERIALVSVQTGEIRDLTAPPQGIVGDRDPAFSPDGSMIAFSRNVLLSAAEVYVVNLNADYSPTGELRQITVGGGMGAIAAWTGDGREIVFSTGHWGSERLRRVSLSRPGKSVPVSFPSHGAVQAAISRDGKRLAYVLETANMNLWRYPTISSRAAPPVKLIASTRIEQAGAYSPDGRKIAFASNRTGAWQIWICDSDGSNLMQLTTFDGPLARAPSWSPDGKRIAFDARYGGDADIHVMNADGTGLRRISFDGSNEVDPIWSPDGRFLTFLSTRGERHALWRVPAAGGTPFQITSSARWGGLAGYSADGKHLYFVTGHDSQLARRDEGTGHVEYLHLTVTAIAVHGDRIYFTRQPEQGSGIIGVFDVKSRKAVRLYTMDHPLHSGFSISPDGRFLLATQIDHEGTDLMLVDAFR